MEPGAPVYLHLKRQAGPDEELMLLQTTRHRQWSRVEARLWAPMDLDRSSDFTPVCGTVDKPL